MKFCNCFILLILFCCHLCAQNNQQHPLYLKNGTAIPLENITSKFLQQYNASREIFNGKSYCIVQLNKPAAAYDQKNFNTAGIKLLEYIPSNAYLVEINKPLEEDALKKLNVRAIISITPERKIEASLTKELQPAPSIKVWVMLYNTVDVDMAVAALQNQGYEITSLANKEYKVLEINTSFNKIPSLSALPFIKYIEAAPPAPTQLNFDSRNLSKANLLQTGIPGNYNLDGSGVVIAVNEVAGSPFPHVDFADREIALQDPTFDYHSTHVNGTVASAGLIYEPGKGYAPGATILTNSSSLNPNYFMTYGMVLSNNSYTTGSACNPGANLGQAIADMQAIAFPYVQNVFGTGNSGNTSCSVYPLGFKTGQAGYGGSKSVIAVGNTQKDGILNNSSSKGPAAGGRIKPDVVATGTDVISTTPNNVYGYNTGTSMAAPAVTGGLALLYQRYKQLHNNQNPHAALMKSILCNTATDAGNPGPDFSYGFGQINLYRAIKTIDANQYFTDSVSNLETKTKKISIPAGGAQVKILLYWQDPPASILSSRSLVNDLDITVTSPSGVINLPYTLDTTAVNVANPAIKAEDHVNNIEQVVIDFPEAGEYSIKIKGTEVDATIANRQEYYVTYDLLPDSIMLDFPSGNEKLLPGEKIKIQWDSWGDSNAGFGLEFSADNGIKWQTINGNIAPGKRQFDWQLPDTTTTNGLIRLTRNSSTSISVVSGKFSMIGQPAISFSTDQCAGSISLQWSAASVADYYEVMKIKGGNMVVVDTISGTNYTFRNLSEDSTYWVAVRSVVNNIPGRRAIAISRKPDNGDCASPAFDNDLKADALITPLTGRELTSTQLRSDEEIVFRIKNLDDKVANYYTISYSINNGNWITENVNTQILASSSLIYHFSTKADFSQPGKYLVKLVVKNNMPDANTGNDTIQYVVRQLANTMIDLTNPLIENFEQAQDKTYSSSTSVINDIDRFDYVKNSGKGTISFPSKAMSDTSGKSLRFDINESSPFSPPGNQFVMATFNLSGHHASASNVLLNFNLSAILQCAGCRGDSTQLLMIRGNDTLPWISVVKLNPTQIAFSNKKFEAINLSKFLSDAGQDFSTSFQVKWEHISLRNTYLLDDIVLYNGDDKLGVLFADSLAANSCNLGYLPIRIKINNTSFTIKNNLKVYYKINNGNAITETIPVVQADSSIVYTFTNLANLTAPGFYTIEAGIDYANGGYPAYNSSKLMMHNQPLIKTFPYLENFENNDGYWYAEGTNSSWAYGKPASTIINKAASGVAAWKTNLTGRYNTNETSYLYSPCIDYGILHNPVISFSLALNTNNCIPGNCSALVLQYSADGVVWNIVSLNDSNYNWSNTYWDSRIYNRWHVVSGVLPVLAGPVQFRFMFRSNVATPFDGVGIDDIHIYDKSMPIFDTPIGGITVTKTITGNAGWNDFTQNGKIIASINSYGRSLGNATLKAHVRNKIPVANFHGQYYLNRNFTLNTDNQHLSDSVGIRFYFTDSETDSLLFAKNCPACYKPADAYRFGISQYHSDLTAEENDSIADNINGEWSFIENQKIKTVPYQNGYYVEFKVKDLSEFWLNSGGTDNKSWLPVKLTNFTVEKTAATTNISWSSASEINISKFEIQAAKNNDAFINNNFTIIGSVSSHGASAQTQLYSYADNAPAKRGVYYYRIKSIDQLGNYAYSKVIPVMYSSDLTWHIYPNPSDGLYKMEYQLNNGEKLKLAIYNVTGQLIKTQELMGNGFIQQAEINLKNKSIAGGMYLVRISTKEKEYYFKLVKQ